MFKPQEIDEVRAENIKTILKREDITQKKLAEMIYMSPENLNRIIKLRQPLTEATAEAICQRFPEYRKEWLLGYDIYATKEEKAIARDEQIRLDSFSTVLDTALLTVCRREEVDVPKLSLPESVFLESQLQDFAEMLMRNYLHRDESHVWSVIDRK